MNLGEYGVVYYLGTSYVMTGNTSLGITFTKPDGTELAVTSPAVTISATPVTTSEGVFAANTYLIYTFVNGDVDQAGEWSARGIYNASGVHLISNPAPFTVDP